VSGETVRVQCPFCFEWNEVPLEDEPPYQTIIDCEVCCHPIDITVAINDETSEPIAIATKSSGFN
jgi:hypothetical protein